MSRIINPVTLANLVMEVLPSSISATETNQILIALIPDIRFANTDVRFDTTSDVDLFKKLATLIVANATDGSSYQIQQGKWVYGAGTFGTSIRTYTDVTDTDDDGNVYMQALAGSTPTFNPNTLQIIVVCQDSMGWDDDADSQQKVTIVAYVPQ